MFVVIFLILSGLFAIGETFDIPEFQYPCYVDICTFPTQFCNSERFERRCSPCTKAVCRAKKVPLACKYICGLNEQGKTTKVPHPTQVALSDSRESSSEDSCQSSLILLTFSAVSTTIIIIVMVIVFACHYLKKHKKKQRNKARQESGQDAENTGLLQMNVKACENGTVVDDRNVRPDMSNDGLPSYTTNDILNVESSGDPVQESSPGRIGGHRQVCNTVATNTKQDEGRVIAARPKYNNSQQAYQHCLYTQPMSARPVSSTSSVGQQTNTSDEREERSLDSRSISVTSRNNTVSNTRDCLNNLERSVASSEETSLKS